MPSARVYHFPKAARRRLIPPVPPRYVVRRTHSRPGASSFGLLLMVTLLAAFLYLTGAVNIARHDVLDTVLLATVWGFYFMHDKLLRIRVLGTLLMRAGRLLRIAAVAGFFGGIYWLILLNG